MHLPRPVRLIDTPRAPNPRRVRIFMAEKAITLPAEPVDIMAGAQFGAHRDRVGTHHVPALELDDGSYLTESVAICRYLEALVPEPNLMGRDPYEAAVVEMWQRRIEFGLLAPIAAVLRHSNPKMAVMEDQCPEWAEANRPRVFDALGDLDARLDASAYVAGGRFTIADITAAVAVDFLRAIRVDVPPGLGRIGAWRAALGSRASFRD